MKLIDGIGGMSVFELLDQRAKSQGWLMGQQDEIVKLSHEQIINEIDAELRIRLAAAKEES